MKTVGPGVWLRPTSGPLPSAPSAAAVVGADLSQAYGVPGAAAPGYLYRWAGMDARVDSPPVIRLLAQGWSIEHVDHRYGTVLMRKEIL